MKKICQSKYYFFTSAIAYQGAVAARQRTANRQPRLQAQMRDNCPSGNVKFRGLVRLWGWRYVTQHGQREQRGGVRCVHRRRF